MGRKSKDEYYTITESELIANIKVKVDELGGIEAAAEMLGTMPWLLKDVLEGRKEIYPRMAAKFGWKKEVRFRKLHWAR